MIILIVQTVVLVIIVGVLVFNNWKRKKQLSKGVEKLLENFSAQELERKPQLSQLLSESYALATEEAEESASYMIEAEKQFLQEFLKQQLEQQPLTDFHSNLCELLDQYLYFIPVVETEDKKESVNEVIENVDAETSSEASIEESVTEQDNIESDEQDTQDETVEEEESQSEEEPDWGEAFAEAGEEMDEEVKAGFEEEVKKET